MDPGQQPDWPAGQPASRPASQPASQPRSTGLLPDRPAVQRPNFQFFSKCFKSKIYTNTKVHIAFHSIASFFLMEGLRTSVNPFEKQMNSMVLLCFHYPIWENQFKNIYFLIFIGVEVEFVSTILKKWLQYLENNVFLCLYVQSLFRIWC